MWFTRCANGGYAQYMCDHDLYPYEPVPEVDEDYAYEQKRAWEEASKDRDDEGNGSDHTNDAGD